MVCMVGWVGVDVYIHIVLNVAIKSSDWSPGPVFFDIGERCVPLVTL